MRAAQSTNSVHATRTGPIRIAFPLLMFLAGFAGCATDGASHPIAGVRVNGSVIGGQNPVTGSLIQLYAVGTTGDASSATPLISATVTTSDGTSAVNSNANAGNANNSLPAGSFTITGDYTCPSATTEVYLVATGGNPGLGGGANPNITLMTALGQCGSLSSSTYVVLNELTTISAVAALGNFIASTTNVGSGPGDAALLQTAFSQVNEYANTANGAVPGPALPAGYSAASTAIQTLGDIVAACVNSAGGVAGDTSACGQLFTQATIPGQAAPTDTVGAVVDILQQPATNVAPIFALLGANGPFEPTLSSAPADWGLHITTPGFSVNAAPCALTGTQYVTYSGCTIAASGGTPPYTYSYDKTLSPGYAPVPPGLTLNASTGAVTGTNYGQGAYTTHFIATDSHGATATVDVPFSLAGNNTLSFPLFPTDTIFHTKVSSLPVDTSWVAQIDTYGNATIKPFFGALPNGYQPNGIPFLVVPYNQSTTPVVTNYYQAYFGTINSASDYRSCIGTCPAGAPIPSYTPIEGYQQIGLLQDFDMHALVVQQPGGGNPASLWEMWVSAYNGTGNAPYWSDGSNALWPNIGSTGAGAYAMLPQGNGSSDAAGLPIAPLILTADEVIGTGTPSAPNGVVQHPVRFTLDSTLGYYVWPATAQAGGGFCFGGYEDGNAMISQMDPPTSCTYDTPSLPPMGEIYRLKASVATPACAATSPQAAVIIQGLRDYGMILADNGVAAAIIGTPDSRWNDADLNCLTSLTFSQFEPVQTEQLAADVSLVESGTGFIVTSCPQGETCYNLPVTTYRTH